MFRIVLVIAMALPAFSAGSILRGDVIELKGGDTIHAQVVKITSSHLTIRHRIFGEVEIPRDQVRGIVLGKTSPRPANAGATSGADEAAAGDQASGVPADLSLRNPASQSGDDSNPIGTADRSADSDRQETPKEIIDRLVNKEFGPQAVKRLERGAVRQPTPEDAVEQLRIEGVDPRLKSSLHLLLPGFGTPEVQTYFDSRVNGLMDGSMTIQDIRKDAIGARDQLKDIMDDLGADGAALQGYFSILDNFIQKTAPPSERKSAERQSETEVSPVAPRK